MTTDSRDEQLRDAWQTQVIGAPCPSSDELRARVERLSRATQRRNIGAIATCAIVFAGCIWWFMQIDQPLARIGALLTVVGVGTIVFQVRANQSGERGAIKRAASMGGIASIAFHREEVERQRDFHRGRRLWTRLALFAPGPLVFFAGFAQAHAEVAGTIKLEALAFVLLLIAAVPVNLGRARGFQRQLDALDRLQKQG
jgi:hypothetical protein